MNLSNGIPGMGPAAAQRQQLSMGPGQQQQGMGMPAQQPFMMGGPGGMMGQPDPDMLFKGFATNQALSGGGFDWGSYNRSQIKTPLDAVAAELGGSASQEDVQYKTQIKMVAFNILTSMIREIAGRQGNAYKRLLSGMEMSKMAFINTPMMQPCAVRTAFVTFVLEQRQLLATIAKNAAICALGIMAQNCCADPNTTVNTNSVYGFFEQWVINITACEMVNWFNHTEQGKAAYVHRSKELEQALGGIDQIVGACSSLFEWFGLPNPYVNLALQKATTEGTMFNSNVIPSGMEYIMKSNQVFNGNNSQNQQVYGSPVSESEFLRRQREMYSNENTNKIHQPRLPSWEDQVVVDTSPRTINGRTDYQNICKKNMIEFDMSFFTRVPVQIEGFEGNVFVTQDTRWNDIKYKLDYAFPNPKRWSGNWLDRDFFYLVVFDENDNWYEQLVNGRGTNWMTSNALIDPAKLLPDLVLDENNLLVLRQPEVPADFATNSFAKIFEKDELGIAKIQENVIFKDSGLEVTGKDGEGLNFFAVKDKGAVIEDEEVLKTPSMDVIVKDLENVASELRPKLTGKDVAIYAKPVINFDTKQIGNRDQIVSFCASINFFVNSEDSDPKSILGLIESVENSKEELRQTSPGFYKFLVEQLTMGLNRWLVEKRGYLGLELKDCIEEYRDLLDLLKGQGDKVTYTMLKDPDQHKWIYDVIRNLYKAISPDTMGNEPVLTFIKRVVINRVINFPYPDYQKDYVVVKKSALPELFTAYEHAVELGQRTMQGFQEVLFSFDDGQWWSFTITDIDSNTAVMRRLARQGSLVDWKLGFNY